MNHEPLNTARGIIIGAAIGAAIWVAAIFVLMIIRGWA